MEPWTIEKENQLMTAWQEAFAGLGQSSVPRFPLFDPASYRPVNAPGKDGQITMPSLRELNLLFAHETRQKELHGGLRTWEALSLADVGSYTPETTYSNTGFESWFDRTLDHEALDEQCWLKMYQRERWFDWKRPIEGWDNKTWSFDDDEVWSRMRPIIGLADRITKTSLKHPWLCALLDETAHQVQCRVMKDGTKANILIFKPTGQPPDAKAQASRLDDFAKYLHWTVSNRVGAFGVTFAYQCVDGTADSMAVLSTALFHQVFDKNRIIKCGKTCGRERTEARSKVSTYFIAKVMVHEVMHSLSNYMMSKVQERNPGIQLSRQYCFEQWFGNERIVEQGASFEQNVLGATCVPPTSGDNALILHLGEFPDYNRHEKSMSQGAQHPFKWPNPARNSCYPLPSVWPVALGTREFWDTHAAKFGPEAIRYPRILESRQARETESKQVWIRGARGKQGLRNYATEQHDMRKTLDECMTLLGNRRKTVMRWRRPWYRREYLRWQSTPYSLRGLLILFSQALEAHSAVSGARQLGRPTVGVSRNLALKLIHPMTVWSEPGKQEMDNLAARLTVDFNPRWYWRALGYLILAAQKVYDKEEETVNHPDRTSECPNQWQANSRTRIMTSDGSPETSATRAAAIATIHAHFTRDYLKLQAYTQKTEFKNLSHSRRRCLDLAQACFNRLRPSMPGYKDLRAFFTRSKNQIKSEPGFGGRKALPFSPNMPAYGSLTDGMGAFDTALPRSMLRGQPEDTFSEYSESSSDEAQVEGKKKRKKEKAQIYAQMARLSDETMIDIAPAPAGRLPYFSVGEIGDHRIGWSATWWVLRQNGDELDVYETPPVEELARVLNFGQFEIQQLEMATWPHHMGRVLHEPPVGGWKTVFDNLTPVGRALQYTRPEEVAHQNGAGVQRAWVSFQEIVYDVTGFELTQETVGLYPLLDAGKSIDHLVDQNELNPNVVANLLAPYTVRLLSPSRPAIGSTTPFTREEVRKHDHAAVGMYVIIDDKVYDIQGYMRHHPGGMQFLQEKAGRDVTKDFMSNHGERALEILEQYDGLRVGDVVETRDWSEDIGPQEIQLLRQVFDLELLQQAVDEESQWLHRKLQQYAGTDATGDLNEIDATLDPEQDLGNLLETHGRHPLVMLKLREECVVAIMVSNTHDLPTVTLPELESLGQEPDALQWVVGGDLVYNVRDLRGERSEDVMKNVFRVLAGPSHRVQETLLRHGFRHRLVARLVKPLEGVLWMESELNQPKEAKPSPVLQSDPDSSPDVAPERGAGYNRPDRSRFDAFKNLRSPIQRLAINKAVGRRRAVKERLRQSQILRFRVARVMGVSLDDGPEEVPGDLAAQLGGFSLR